VHTGHILKVYGVHAEMQSPYLDRPSKRVLRASTTGAGLTAVACASIAPYGRASARSSVTADGACHQDRENAAAARAFDGIRHSSALATSCAAHG
jgi:hypothetical protein